MVFFSSKENRQHGSVAERTDKEGKVALRRCFLVKSWGERERERELMAKVMTT